MADKSKKTKYTSGIKKGFEDIQAALQEGNIKLFLKQFVVVLVVFLLYRYMSGKFTTQMQSYEGQLEAIKVQKTNEQEYTKNKQLLLSLEPLFPEVSSKNDWLLSQLLGIFKDANVTPDISPSQEEDASNSTYLVTSLQANTMMEFSRFAEFLASIENREDLIKVSGFSLDKETDRGRLGINKISMKFNAVFPKEKIAKSLFKDYGKYVSSKEEKGKTKRKGR